MGADNENELNANEIVNIRQSLDESIDVLDTNTVSKIRQVRAQAMERVETRNTNWLTNRQGLFIGGLATVCVVVLAVMLLLNPSTSVPPVPIDDLGLISSSDNLELFEDLEFYEWLEQNDLQS